MYSPDEIHRTKLNEVECDKSPTETRAAITPEVISEKELTLVQTKMSDIFISTALIIIIAVIIAAWSSNSLTNRFRWIPGPYVAFSIFGIVMIGLNLRYCLGDRRVSFSSNGFWTSGNKSQNLTRWASVSKVSIKQIKSSSFFVELFSVEQGKPMRFSFNNVFANDVQLLLDILAGANVPHEVSSGIRELKTDQLDGITPSATVTLKAVMQDGILDRKALEFDNPFLSDSYATYPVFWKQALRQTMICGLFRTALMMVLSIRIWSQTPSLLFSPFLLLFVLAIFLVRAPLRQITFQPEGITIPDWLVRFTTLSWDDIDQSSLSELATDGEGFCVNLKLRTRQNKMYCIRIFLKEKREFFALLRTIDKKSKTINLDQSVVDALSNLIEGKVT